MSKSHYCNQSYTFIIVMHLHALEELKCLKSLPIKLAYLCLIDYSDEDVAEKSLSER